jgi:predicted transposase/invertase (TIGR01784 family)
MVDLEHGSFLKGDYKFKKCYSLWFLNFKLFNDNLAIHTVANMVKETKEEFALEVGCITIVELVKFDKTEYNKDVWKQIFFTNDLSLIKGDDEVMDKVKDTIEYMNDDEMLREILIALDRKERNENAERNAVKEKALAEGLAEGKKQGVEEVVISSYENKLSLELISTITKLTVDEIKEVLKKNNINVKD